MGEVVGFPVRPDKAPTPPDSNKYNQAKPADPPAPGKAPGVVSLHITMSPDGKANVTGPITNKILCYGLLEVARDIIRNFEAPPNILTPDPNIRRILGV